MFLIKFIFRGRKRFPYRWTRIVIQKCNKKKRKNQNSM